MSVMNNYKVIENRPVLTPEQVKAGMNFEKIKNSVPPPKKVFPKWILIAGVAGIVSIASMLFVYYSRNNSKPEPSQTFPRDTTNKNMPVMDSSAMNDKDSHKLFSVPASSASKKIIQRQKLT